MKILADASLAGVAGYFPPPFRLCFYHDRQDLKEQLGEADVLLCRSTLKVNADLLHNHQPKYVATASSGIDHIDHLLLEKAGIGLFDAKGSNAASVADYVLSCLAYCETHYVLNGAKVAVIGAGSVGALVTQHLRSLHYSVVCYDPPRQIRDSLFGSATWEEVLHSDILCIHANLHNESLFPTYGLLDSTALQQLQSNTLIINASRGGIVVEDALLKLDKPLYYCTDVFLQEPHINSAIVDYSQLCTPHIAGHSMDAKSNALRILSQKLHAAYQLPQPEEGSASFQEMFSYAQHDILHWRQQALEHYNPMVETTKLKAAQDLTAAFLQLRQAHTGRYDRCYSIDSLADLRQTEVLI